MKNYNIGLKEGYRNRIEKERDNSNCCHRPKKGLSDKQYFFSPL